MKKIYTSTYNEDGWSYYLDLMQAEARKCSLVVEGTPDSLEIYTDGSDTWDLGQPSFNVMTELDSDGEDDYIYFLPLVKFQAIDCTELNFADSFEYFGSKVESLGKFIKWLQQNPYQVTRRTGAYEEY